MICLRCGYCCIVLDIAIVNPSSIKSDGTINSKDPASFIFKPYGIRCPHLISCDGIAECAIHSLPCYKGTPCQQFEQVGPEDDVWVLKEYLRIIETHRL